MTVRGNKRGRAWRALAAAGVLACSGCATSSLFVPHPARTASVVRQLEAGRPVDAERAFGRLTTGADRVLYLMEAGRAAQVQGDFETSRRLYARALEAMREADERAVLSLSEIYGGLSAVLVNDNAIPYAGEGYERVMLHQGQALNYLLAGDVEGAGVEVRNAAARQAEALRLRARELEEAQRQAREWRWAQGAELAPVYARLDPVAGRVKNSFQNAYVFYLSGVVRERLGDPGGAYIDYKKAAELQPGHPAVQADVLRLAAALGMWEEESAYRAAWPAAGARAVPDGFGEVVVFFEEGFLPAKEEVSVWLPLPGWGGWTALALPVFAGEWRAGRPAGVWAGGDWLGETEVICEVGALAARALRERMPAILTRQVLRAGTKMATVKLAGNRQGEWAVVLASIYNLFSERADLRGWTTLPARAQVWRGALPAGEHDLDLAHADHGARVRAVVRLGGLTVVWAVRVGARFEARAVSF